MTRILLPFLEKTYLAAYSRYRRRRFFQLYRQPLYVTINRTNLFLNTPLPFFNSKMCKYSAGLIQDFANRKKRKKTYMAGFELAHTAISTLRQFRITGLQVLVKGHGAQKRGVLAFIKKTPALPIIRYHDATPVAHNGTRAAKRRRL